MHIPPRRSVGSAAAVHVELEPITKSVAFAPVSWGPGEIERLSLPALVRVTVKELGSVCPCEVSGKFTDAGFSVIPKPVPVPRKSRVCGLPIPSSVTCSEAVSSPITEGANVMEKAHEPPAAIGEFARQLSCDSTKSPAFAPVTVIPVTFRAALPEFVTRMFSGGEFVPSPNEPRFATDGLNATQPAGFVFAFSSVRKASVCAGEDWQLAQIGWTPV